MMQRYRYLRRIFVVLCLLLLCTTVAFGTFAFAESAQPASTASAVVEFSFTIKPDRMVAPGDATMTFTIVNHSAQDLQNVYLTSGDGLLAEPIGQIGAGDTQTLIRMHTVTQDELEAGGISYSISWDSANSAERMNQTATAAIVRDDASPGVDFTRQLSSVYVDQGGVLTITYKIRNTGNVVLSGLRLQDTLGEFTGRLEQLGVGESKSFISRVNISSEALSSPVLEYSVPSGAKFTLSLDPASIQIANSQLGIVFSVGQSVFDDDTADVILTLTNTGNLDYTDIMVLDDIYGGIIADSITLPSGGNPIEVPFSYPIRGQTQYRWRITGVNGAGQVLDTVTDTMTLNPAEVSAHIEPHIAAAARTPRINHGGVVTFDITVTNSGTAMAHDIRLYEYNHGDIRRLTVLPTDAPTQLTADFDVQSDTSFSFCLDYSDEMGMRHTTSSAPVEVVITSDGVSPEQGRNIQQLPGGDPVKVGTASSTFISLIVFAAVLLLILGGILLRFYRKSHKNRRERIAAEKQRIKEELGKTAEFTPIKRTNRNRK